MEQFLQEGSSSYQDIGWWVVGTSSFQKKDYSKALNQLQSIQNKDQFQTDELIQINYMTGVCQFQKGNYKNAKNLLNDIKELPSPYKGQVNYLLAYILISEKDREVFFDAVFGDKKPNRELSEAAERFKSKTAVL